MPKAQNVRFAIASGLALISVSAFAQNKIEPPAQSAGRGIDVRLDMLQRGDGLDPASAARQLRLSDEFEEQIQEFTAKFPDSYLSSRVEYGRNFKITIFFDREVPMSEVQQALPPSLRPSVQVKRSRLGREEIQSTKQRIIEQLSKKFSTLNAAFDFPSDRFVVFLEDGFNESDARGLLDPGLRAFVDFRKGASRPLAGALTNADDPTHSDKTAIWGGWPLIREGVARCTSSFIIQTTDAKELGLLTAAHCPDDRITVRWNDGTFKTMIDAYHASFGGNYDMQVHWAGFLNSAGYFWIDNDVSGSYRSGCAPNGTGCTNRTFRNLYSGVSTMGYIAVEDADKGNSWSSFGYNDSHIEGTIRCKYGMVTGTTCGRILYSSADGYVNEDGTTYKLTNFVKLKIDPSWQAAVAKGDSGGPVFALLSTSGTFPTAKASGLSSGANVVSTGVYREYRPCVSSLDGDCFVDYMPIDRINDLRPYGVVRASSSTPIEVN